VYGKQHSQQRHTKTTKNQSDPERFDQPETESTPYTLATHLQQCFICGVESAPLARLQRWHVITLKVHQAAWHSQTYRQ
jgi:hypothetical protein